MNSFIHVNGVCVPAGKGRYRHYINQTIKYCIVMKLFLAILLLNLNVSVAAYSQRIDLAVKNQSFRDVMTSIREQSGYYFMFPTEMLKNAKPVTVTLNNASIEETLQKICEDQPFTYIIKDKAILLRLKTEKPETTPVKEPKKADIRGTITDTEGRPLAGVTVIVAGQSNMGTSTNDLGEFILTNVPESGKLIVRMIGYASKEVSYTATNVPRILLSQIDTDMDEIQVIGYGNVSKRLNTGNVGTIRTNDIEKQNINNPIMALQGRIAGVEISQANGIAGGAVKINIRGINTLIQGADPLFVVDGVPYSSNLFSTPFFSGLNSVAGGSGQNLGLNPLSLINPSDIESIDILKDADATAIYGSRGSNGVVLITTKKGSAGPIKLNFNLNSGFGKVARKVKLLNTAQYFQLRKEAFANDDEIPSAANAKDLISWDPNAYTDWQDVMIGGTSSYNDAQASISGGDSNIQYLIGTNYHRETTVFPGDWSDNKGSVHFNLSNTSSDKKFKVMLSGSFLSDNNQLPTTDYTQFITLAPNAPNLYLPNGKLDWVNFSSNPFRSKEVRYIAKTNNLLSNGVLSYLIIPGLELKTSLGYNNILLNEKRLSPISANSPASGKTTGSASFNTNNLRSWIIEPQLNFYRNIGGGTLSVLIGGTIQRRNIEGQIINGDGYTDDGLLGSLAAASTTSKGESVYEEHKYSSIFSRINYNLKNKYLINLTGRRDGSSRFGPGKQYGNFGAIGLGWIFSAEKFMNNLLPTLSYGKLRASYGTSGNEPGLNYQFFELYNFSNSFPYGGGLGTLPNNLPTADYRWEVNRKAEIGLELGFFQERILLSGSYYKNRSSNQLISSPLPSITGFSSITANLGATIQNQGFEFVINSVNIKNRDFTWTTGFNLSAARNKLIKFPNFENSGFQYVYTIGQPVNSRRSYRLGGVNTENGRYQFYDHLGEITQTPDDILDMTSIINILPKYYGGIQNSFTYKGFSLDLNFYFVKQLGHNYLFSNAVPPGWINNPTGQGNQVLDVIESLSSKDKPGLLQRPSQSFDSFLSYLDVNRSDGVYSDASYIRLRNVYLGYTFSNKLIKKARIQTLKVYLQGQNLLTFTNFKGADPENQNFTVLPPLKVITAGIQVSL